jgi:hypothetical protein
MEYPDKYVRPLEYLKVRLLEIQNADIPQTEKGWVNKIGREASSIHEQIRQYAIEKIDLYLIDVLDYICDLVLVKGDHRNEEPLINELIDDSRNAFEKISELIKIMDRFMANTDTLEIKVLSRKIRDNMKKANEK